MKKTLEISTLKGIFAWFLVCVVFWIVVFADWNTLKSFRNTWWSDAPNMENKLSADTWNSVLAELDHLRDELSWALNSPNLVIPHGAIMAFDSKTGCPDDTWEIYTVANGRFLMGVWFSDLSKVGDTWWSSTQTLVKGNLPPHSHRFKDTVFNEYWEGWMGQTINGQWMDNGYLMSSNTDLPWARSAVWSSETDYDNDIVYWERLSYTEVCWATDSRFVRASTWNSYWRLAYNCTSSAQPFSIQNPYVKVVYCRKK